MTTIEFDLEVRCAECNSVLKAEMYRGYLDVSPCKKCDDASYEQGKREGREEAKE